MIFDRYFASLSSWLDWSSSIVDIWLGKHPSVVRRATTSDAAACAAIHAQCFAHPWSSLTFEQLLSERGVNAHVVGGASSIDGFILVRATADEAEILSVAVRPEMRRAKIGARLLEASLDDLARARMTAVFLEVEDGNTAALALYHRFGFFPVGRRKGYYRKADGVRDALTMRMDIAQRPIKAPMLDV